MIVKTLTIRRLDTTIREFRLLHFNLTAARAFFQVAPFSLFPKIERNVVTIETQGDTVGEEEDTASISANS